MELNGLEEFKFQQIREMQWFGDALAQMIRRDRMNLDSIDRTKEAGVGIMDHGSPVSNACISSTSS